MKEESEIDYVSEISQVEKERLSAGQIESIELNTLKLDEFYKYI